MPKTLMIIDGNSLLHRAYHALPDMRTRDGSHTGAVYGFMSMLLRILQERQPDYLAVAFDMHGPTFRHGTYAEYKAKRKPTDPELIEQFPTLRELLSAMHIAQLEAPTFEADDILGTVAARCEAEGIGALLVTGDRDALQLVTEKTHVIYTRRGITETIEFDPKGVCDFLGVPPERVPDLKGLMGDSSDNIPGVPGVGEKTAVKLLAQYGTLEAALEAAPTEQKGKLRERLIEFADQARLSKDLATITREVPLTLTLQELIPGELGDGLSMFEALEFHSLMPRLQSLCGEAAPPSPVYEDGVDWHEILLLDQLEDMKTALTAWPKGPFALYIGPEAVTLAHPDGQRWQIPLTQDLLTQGLELPGVLAALSVLFTPEHPLVTYEAKRLLTLLAECDLPLPLIADDVLLLAYLLSPQSKQYALQSLVSGEANAWALWSLRERQLPQLSQQGMLDLYRQVEMPLMWTLFSMEREGFMVDRAELSRLGSEYTSQIDSLRVDIYDKTGVPGFNLNSPKQLGEVLFDKLSLPAGRKTKSGWSTDAETLENLQDAHPAISLILSYRQVAKLHGTYIEGLLRLTGPDGRVHTWFDQTAAATGRISSTEPNLQNIPVRSEMGREIRRAFIARPGCLLVDADYSQIELRLLAHLSGDEGMLEAFLTGQDIHIRTAAQVYDVALEEVTPAMRSAAKAVNFGIVYGISDFGLSRNIGISRAQAGAFIQRYFERYPGVKQFMDRAVVMAKTAGYAETLLGRRRPVPELDSRNYNTRSFGERIAMNTPVQGSAADIIKLAMVRVRAQLAEESLEARLILQVHDELIVETPEAEVPRVSQIVQQQMEHAMTLAVPLVADVHVGASWFEAK